MDFSNGIALRSGIIMYVFSLAYLSLNWATVPGSKEVGMMGQWAGWLHSNNRLLSLGRLHSKLKIEKPQPCGPPTYVHMYVLRSLKYQIVMLCWR